MKQAASQEYSRALQIQPKSEVAFFGMLNYYVDVERWKDALALVAANGHYFSENIQVDIIAGHAALQVNNSWRALVFYGKALEKDGKNVSALTGMAAVADLFKNGDWSLRLFEEAFEQNPKDGNVAYNVAIIYWRKGDKNQAKNWYEKALSLGTSKDARLESLLTL